MYNPKEVRKMEFVIEPVEEVSPKHPIIIIPKPPIGIIVPIIG